MRLPPLKPPLSDPKNAREPFSTGALDIPYLIKSMPLARDLLLGSGAYEASGNSALGPADCAYAERRRDFAELLSAFGATTDVKAHVSTVDECHKVMSAISA
jgi:hypothetical protein